MVSLLDSVSIMLKEPDSDAIESDEASFNRPPRILRLLPRDEIEIPAPPRDIAATATRQIIMILLPLLTAGLYLVIAVGRGGQGGSLWLSLPIIGISLVSAGLGFYNYRQQQRRQHETQQAQENGYIEVLETIRHRLVILDQEQRTIRFQNDPNLNDLLLIACRSAGTDGIERPGLRLWERRPSDGDFLSLRIGRADLPTSITIKTPQANEFEASALMRRAFSLVETFSIVRDVPLTLSLLERGALGIAGPSGTTLGLVRAMLWQIATHHAPHEVRIAAFWDSRYDNSWNWLRWLPHTHTLDGDDSYRLLAHYNTNPADLQQALGMLAQELQQRIEQGNGHGRPHIVVVIGDYQHHGIEQQQLVQLLRAGRTLGFSLLCLVEHVFQVPGECDGYIDLGSSPHLALTGLNGGRYTFTPDFAERQHSVLLAQQHLAPIVQATSDGRRELPRSVRLLSLFEQDNGSPLDARTYDPQIRWNTLPAEAWHPIPCGMAGPNEPLMIDLNEGVHGVHGIIAGTTGSGKSEFLLTFLLALAIRHSPDRVTFLLIDFKGGATFGALEKLPHTLGVVTDLEGYMAERALIAINSELDRRKKKLARANMPNISSYRRDHRQWEQVQDFGPMPNLMIIIDEFDELARDFPDFVLELVRVAKQGRSLGVHLLFATQQPSQIKEGLLRNLSYWIALRVTAADDSKTMVRIPDASYLTSDTPGRAFFRANRQVVQFQSARVTLPYQPPQFADDLGRVDATGRQQSISTQTLGSEELRTILTRTRIITNDTYVLETLVDTFFEQYQALADTGRLPRADALTHDPTGTRQIISQILNTSIAQAYQHVASDPHATPLITGETMALLITLMQGEREQVTDLELIVAQMQLQRSADYAATAYPMWMPPLPSNVTLADLFAASKTPLDWMQVPIGLVDIPAQAQQQHCVLQPTGSDGNIIVVGVANVGKTTLLRTIALGLAARHSPQDVWFYTIDVSGAGLGMAPLNGPRLIHVADALGMHEAGKIERLLIELQGQIDLRRQLLTEHGVDTLNQYRERQHQNSELPLTPPMILVLIDGFTDRLINEDAREGFKTIFRDGRAYGIGFVISSYSVREIQAVLTFCDTRIALRLNESSDSEATIGKAFATRIKLEQPGRAFLRTADQLAELQIGLPTFRKTTAEQWHYDPMPDLHAAISEINALITLPAEKCPRPLRALPPLVALDELDAGDTGTPIALDHQSLKPLYFDFTTTPHLLISGGVRSGKSSLLHTIAMALARQYRPDELQFVFVDYRREVFNAVADLPHTRVFERGTPGSKDSLLPMYVCSNTSELTILVKILVQELKDRQGKQQKQPKIVFAVNCWDALAQADSTALSELAPYALQGHTLGFHCIIDIGTEGFSSTNSNPLLKAIRLERSYIYLGYPDATFSMPGVKFPKPPLQGETPAGRGFFIRHGQLRLAQFAFVASTTKRSTHVNNERIADDRI